MIRVKTTKLILSALIFSSLFLLPYKSEAVSPDNSLYNRQIKDALADCNFEQLLKIENSVNPKSPEFVQISKALQDAKCQYFFDCAIPTLNQAYINCDFDVVLDIENKIVKNLSGCLEYGNIKEKMLSMKCIYFETCLKKDLIAAQKNCNWEEFQRIEKFMRSSVLRDCSDYQKMLNTVREYKCDTFNLCSAKELKTARTNCNLDKVLEIEKNLKTNLTECANYPLMNEKVNLAKCDYPAACVKQMDAAFNTQTCQPKKLNQLEALWPLKEWESCSSYQYQVMENRLHKMECNYLDKCASFEYESAQKQCELEELAKLENKLQGCNSQPQLLERLKTNKAQISARCEKQFLKQAVQNCDLSAIEKRKKSLAGKTGAQAEELKELVVQSELDYFKHCLEPKLKNGVDNCNLEVIKNTGKEISDELVGHPKQNDMLKQVKEKECLYFVSCTQRKLDKAVDDCDYEQIKTLKRLSKQEDVTHCPNYEAVEPEISDAMQRYYYSCAEKELYKAYKKCDWEGILRVEKMVEEDMKFYPDYRKIRVLVLEVKCSYFMSCLEDKLNQAVAAKDRAKIEEYKNLINKELATCPNYSTLSRIIQDALDKTH